MKSGATGELERQAITTAPASLPPAALLPPAPPVPLLPPSGGGGFVVFVVFEHALVTAITARIESKRKGVRMAFCHASVSRFG
jgi:hypothetical protein